MPRAGLQRRTDLRTKPNAVVRHSHTGSNMYVCSCNAFTDADVKAVASPAGDSVAAVFRCLGCRPQCGGCVLTIRKILDAISAEFDPTDRQSAASTSIAG